MNKPEPTLEESKIIPEEAINILNDIISFSPGQCT